MNIAKLFLRLSFGLVISTSAIGFPLTKANMGRLLFRDTSLSNPPGQSCATCHQQRLAFSDHKFNSTSRGVVPGRVGPRNAPTALYTAFVPPLYEDPYLGFRGGLFVDGRVDSLEQQARAPFLNPLEMNNPSPAAVVEKVKAAPYAKQFKKLFGADALDDPDRAFGFIAEAIAELERSEMFHPFTSKFDAHLAGTAVLTRQEMRGLDIFESPDRGNCVACHDNQPGLDGTPPLFTNFTYHNLGVPKNPANRFYTQAAEFNPDGAQFVDLGLGDFLHDPAQNGKFRTPTLRNVALTAPYTHNGYFTNLRALVEFYGNRDLKPTCRNVLTSLRAAQVKNCWPVPEVADTMDRTQLGQSRLTDREIDDLVAFLLTLTDGYKP